MERLKVLTINIWNRQGPWDERRALLRAGIDELAPHVVAMQEVLALDGAGDQAHEILDGSDYQLAVFPAWQIGAGMTMGNAIASLFPIVEQELWRLPGAQPSEQRCLGYALLDAPCGRVPVFATHLNWKLHHGHIRVEQTRFIADRIAEKAPTSGYPPVLMGDFNAEPDSDEMRFLRGLTPLGGRAVYFADCWASCNDQGPGYTYSRSNPYALRTREPSRRLDYIYSRGPDRSLRGEPLEARLVLDQPTNGVFPSDHYGVYAELQAAVRALDKA